MGVSESGLGAGIVQVRSRFSVAETAERLLAALAAKGITLFALIDHSGEAAEVGMRMPETKLLVFGSPKAGTPVVEGAGAGGGWGRGGWWGRGGGAQCGDVTGGSAWGAGGLGAGAGGRRG